MPSGNKFTYIKIAAEESITFYDASYIQAAIQNTLTLITNDEKIRKKGKKYLKTLKTNEP